MRSGAARQQTQHTDEAIELAGLRLSSPDKVLYPTQGTTKRTLAEYYLEIGDRVLAHAARRPLTLVRCPRGRSEKCFYQRHHGAGLPTPIHSILVQEKQGKAECVYIEDIGGLVAAVQIGVLELHLWGSRIEALDKPDRLVMDLDPDEGLDFGDVKKAAMELREVLAEAGLETFALLTGGKGIHVVAPLQARNNWAELKEFSRDIAIQMAERAPDRYVATASKAKRQGRIYIDYLRNERGATAVAPYASRARPNCPIATPVSWRELSRLRSANQYDISNIARRLVSLKSDPWEDYFDIKQTLPTSAVAQGQ